MSDIDLSFLTETVESISTPSSKALNDAALKELQGSLTAQSLDALEGDSSNNVQGTEGLVHSLSDPPEDPESKLGNCFS